MTLRGLEVFVALAHTRSLAQAAKDTDLSQPSVSQQLRNLETAFGCALMDRSTRPMALTSAGRRLLPRAERALMELARAEADLTRADLGHLDHLALGMIDDFDATLTPRLAADLAETLHHCRFRLITAPSRDITDRLLSGALDMGVAARPMTGVERLIEQPIVRDPFLLVAPRNHIQNNTLETIQSTLPLLRYPQEQVIGQQIETHLGPDLTPFASRFEIGSHQAMMALVARGLGWAITTPLGYMRAARLHDDIAALPLPYAPCARQISLFASPDWGADIPRDIADQIRSLLHDQILLPALALMPWLEGDFHLLPR